MYCKYCQTQNPQKKEQLKTKLDYKAYHSDKWEKSARTWVNTHDVCMDIYNVLYRKKLKHEVLTGPANRI